MRCTLNTVEYAPSPESDVIYLVWSLPKITLATFITIIAAVTAKIVEMKFVCSQIKQQRKGFQIIGTLYGAKSKICMMIVENL